MGVYKLSEQDVSNGQHSLDYFDQEQAIADWYANYEVTQKVMNFDRFNILANVTTDTFETLCYQPLMRRMSQIVWLTTVRLHSVLQYLIYSSAQNDMSDHALFRQQILIDELVGEWPYGKRAHIPYFALFPLLPLLTALSQVHLASFLQTQIMTEMNSSFTSLVSLEFGWVNFRGQPHCLIGVDTFGVTSTDSLATMYIKIFPAIKGRVQDVIANSAPAHAHMEASLAMSIRVSPAYLGPPIQFTHSPLGLGLLRLCTSHASSFPQTMSTLRASMVCYNTLETRRSMRLCDRCGHECDWCVALDALRCSHMWHLWRLTKFDLTDWECGLLLSTHLQSLGGAVTLFESAMLTGSSLPLLFGYHLPQDHGFVVSTTSLRLRGFDELLVTLGLTWIIHFGMEIGSTWDFTAPQEKMVSRSKRRRKARAYNHHLRLAHFDTRRH
ncbi:Aste57867_3740 [Aphanomyces stellatus]|uniref:Aste57867_3740 protein n=1 Tax=Aphanomyces stellatus TaxID=120398 RepID=A0A485KFQ6_9STRA|nr:hypothetical protein As57867_003729 [Aphanomyces stellatus]VFT80893.1 Aste57867_3740 [Aphanomyces stellatus]